jgi:TRAP transporter TAXI family solute receptor
MPYKVKEPRLNRSVTLHLKGDWGLANLHRICGWLAQEINDRAGPHSRTAIWTGRGGTDSVQAVGRGEVDVALAVPACFVPMALDGSGIFGGEAFPNLRALGTMPQTDRLIVAVRADKGVSSFAELRAKAPALTIATCQDDGCNTIGYAAQRMMEAAGIPRAEIERWGGRYVEAERPNDSTEAVRTGKADAIIHEAIMTHYWKQLADEVDLRFLPVEPEVLAKMKSQYRWPSARVAKGYLRGVEQDFETLEFSDFAVVCREDLPEDVAYLFAWVMCERREMIERAYRHLPPERSPVTYPLDPAKIARTPIPLHPGAARYYRDAGLPV